ncbi:ABC transporter permease [uncultured Desulfovibrio sp.]|uniref:MlaE family ABC transporter permease n=1 Tax=uncultured Desulfovibrio sp. TaxID=167968 RepID=UPI00261D601C|nr:ABC transporter permease [uncultured Desulfovibrio sp.]
METSPQVSILHRGDLLTVSIGGSWKMGTPLPSQAREALAAVRTGGARGLLLRCEALAAWDSSLLVFLMQLVRAAQERDLDIRRELPHGLERLVQLAFAVPAKQGASRTVRQQGIVADLGTAVLALPGKLGEFAAFVGDVTLALLRFLTGRSQMRRQDLLTAMYECGVLSLPIISLTSLLFGLILAFVGAVQLTQFGAQIYVAGLVGIGMLRVMGAVMVGVVMSGRVGASFAALIGTMQVNEEVDALSTLGISPIDFLVLPRMLALTLMVPLLTVYADLMGILGGFFVGVAMLDLSALEYLNATVRMVSFSHGIIGLSYAVVFGVIIALSGCYQGIRCGRSAQAVGKATTTAVVHGIVGIIVATAIITVLCNVLKV